LRSNVTFVGEVRVFGTYVLFRAVTAFYVVVGADAMDHRLGQVSAVVGCGWFVAQFVPVVVRGRYVYFVSRGRPRRMNANSCLLTLKWISFPTKSTASDVLVLVNEQTGRRFPIASAKATDVDALVRDHVEPLATALDRSRPALLLLERWFRTPIARRTLRERLQGTSRVESPPVGTTSALPLGPLPEGFVFTSVSRRNGRRNTIHPCDLTLVAGHKPGCRPRVVTLSGEVEPVPRWSILT
jgi:hypothetical protein